MTKRTIVGLLVAVTACCATGCSLAFSTDDWVGEACDVFVMGDNEACAPVNSDGGAGGALADGGAAGATR